jgi:D-alanine--poly(phosphoribitol) ligase subunit 1
VDVVQRIDAWARLNPQRLAHISPSGQLTYADLRRGSDAVAAFIRRALPDDRSPLLVAGHKEPEMLLAFLGSAKAGHPYVPVDVSLPPQRVERIVATSGSRLTLTPDRVREALQVTAEPHRAALRGDDAYYVMFTSGSTGEPKGVTITVECLSSFVDWMLAEHPLQHGEEVFLNQAPFSFDLSVMDTYLSLVTGGTLLSLTGETIGNPRRLYQALEDSRVTTWVSTPSFAQLCLAEARFDSRMLPRLRRFLFCGETLPWALAAQLLERFPNTEVWNTYGPTEATVATTSIRVDRAILERYAVLPVGTPKPDSRVLVVDEHSVPVREGQRGEIVIAGPNVSPGYLNRPDLTRTRFFKLEGQRAYRTGDIGHFEDGLLFFEGRMDNQIKLHGYRIEIGDVETNLRSVAGVRDGVVVPVYRDGRVDALAAFVVGDWTAATDFEAALSIRRALADRVPAYMVPRFVKAVAAFPMTPNGKIDRHALAASLA